MRSFLLAALIVPSFLGCRSNEESANVADAVVEDTAVEVAVDTSVADTAIADAPKDVSFPDPFVGCTKDPGPGTVTVPETETGDDPIGGADKFTMAMAMQGFPGGVGDAGDAGAAGDAADATSASDAGVGTLKAAITTELGVIVCTLDEAKAPISVANFVGLARGTRPFQDLTSGKWVVRRFYDGLKWHRVIYDFVIQGGDPRGNGTGGPGYDLVNENHVAEPAGTLAMAAGATPSGSQFYIVVGKGPAADYNVFGKCELEVASNISLVETNAKDAPKVPIHMTRIDIARCP